VRGVVVGHGNLPEGLVDAVRQITGADGDAIAAVSNRGLGPDGLRERLHEAMGEGPALVFVDLRMGSCGMAARRIARERPDTAVLFGVNLPQLLDFVTHRELPLEEIVARALERGRSAICCDDEPNGAHADRPASDR
jgi:mannose/fructose-specific phosphotransferase system component IIA